MYNVEILTCPESYIYNMAIYDIVFDFKLVPYSTITSITYTSS